MKIRYAKSQSSMEFFTLVGFAFLAAVILVSISVKEIKEVSDKKEFVLIEDLGLKLEKEVVIASYVEDGYERSFDLPEKLQSTVDYFINTTNSTITINSSKSAFSVAVPLVSGRFEKGSNKIERINGKVYINR